MRRVRMLSAAILATTGLVAVGATTEAANASSKDLTVAHTHIMKYEQFYAYGTMSTHVARTVKLQYRTHTDDPWTTKMTTTSNASGYFVFSPISTSKTRYWRYYAPATASLSSIKGYSKELYVVGQSVKYFAVTPDKQSSQCPNDVVMFAQFYPARPNRKVMFETNLGVKYGYEDGKGIATVSFAPGGSEFSYAAVATATSYYGAASKSSSPYTYSQSSHICL